MGHSVAQRFEVESMLGQTRLLLTHWLRRGQISTIHDDILDKQTYIPTVYDIYMVDSHVKRYFQVAHNIQILENSPELGAQLRKSTKLTGACLISRLNFTVKSHKPQGQVSVRNLHCSGKYSFQRRGVMVAKKIGQQAGQHSIPH